MKLREMASMPSSFIAEALPVVNTVIKQCNYPYLGEV
jgi:hypothetical protein